VQKVPGLFARLELPEFDLVLTLQDEDDLYWEIKYNSSRYHLYSGWRRFAINHNLKLGDEVIFSLAGPIVAYE
jgi:uncharacterized protein (UPF0548 family)